jgi:urease accessory protein
MSEASPMPLSASVRVLQLASQALPTGAFAYSAGLESAVELGAIKGESDGIHYLTTLLSGPVKCVELPLFLRMQAAFQRRQFPLAAELSAYLLACRETRELQAQDRQMARSLRRVLADLWGTELPSEFAPVTFAEAIALACVHYRIAREEAALLCAYTWVEQHTTALSRLLPLGPLASQRVVDALCRALPGVVSDALELEDGEIGMSSPGLAIMSSLHETQYSRVFRS